MNWLEFFFGWLIKGQHEVSLLDNFMFALEISLLLSFFVWIISKKGE